MILLVVAAPYLMAGGLRAVYWTDPHPWDLHGRVWSLLANFAVAIAMSRPTSPPSAETVERIHGELERYVYGTRA